ncbi:MAG: glycosyltransferase family 4 protein [Vicinamibacteria bacterium]|nr:glycosyltransferase family 4 protein [Vicinamibacteria bacterium]
MKILMVTPHVPPYQSANALLPHLLGEALRARGHEARFLAYGNGQRRMDVTFIRRRAGSRATRIPQALEALETWLRGTSLLRWADLVHIHSNTWMNQVAAKLAGRHPLVLTHYGTEIWHYDGKDPMFRKLNARARHVAFYSQALLEHARALSVPLPAASVIYPPVADVFRPIDARKREDVRRRFMSRDGVLLLNVKRLHPLADQATLLTAFARIAKRREDAALLIAGAGESESALRRQASDLGITERVRFLGLVPNEEVADLQCAADLFVLSSTLEATPTVALEALAAGTPVVSTDNPGGIELHRLFGKDLVLAPMRDPDALAAAVLGFLESPRRTNQETNDLIEERFRIEGVVTRYLAVYQKALVS